MENKLSSKSVENLLADLDLRVGATLLPSGRIFRFPMMDLEQISQEVADGETPQAFIDVPSSPEEKRQAELLTSFTRVPPIFARVFVRHFVEPNFVEERTPTLPPVNRIVFVPL